MVAHRLGDAGIGGQLGRTVVLGRHRVDLRHDDVGVDVDRARRGSPEELVVMRSDGVLSPMRSCVMMSPLFGQKTRAAKWQ